MTIICSFCKNQRLADPRNGHRQKFCSRKACQHARRNHSQRERRAKAQANRLTDELRLASVKAGRPPEAAFDAVITAKHPLIYGLISMLIDSLDKNDIEAAMRRLWTRGQEILMPPVASNATARRAKEPITPFQNSTA